MCIMVKNERITIAVTPDIHEKLTKLGKYGESMNDIISRIISEYKKSGGGRISQ